jgi:hypothetical protein
VDSVLGDEAMEPKRAMRLTAGMTAKAATYSAAARRYA